MVQWFTLWGKTIGSMVHPMGETIGSMVQWFTLWEETIGSMVPWFTSPCFETAPMFRNTLQVYLTRINQVDL